MLFRNHALRFDVVHKGIDQIGTKGVTPHRLKPGKRLPAAFSFLIGSVGGHGIKAVRYGDDFGAQGDITGLQAAGITGSIHALMVIIYVFEDRCREIAVLHQQDTEVGVPAHLFFHFFTEAAGSIIENLLAQTNLADIMQQAAKTDFMHLFGFETDSSGQTFGVCGNPACMSLGITIFGPKSRKDGAQFMCFIRRV